MARLHRGQFLQEIRETWPTLWTEINVEQGLLQLGMAVVCRFPQKLIDCGKRDDLIRCFGIVEKYCLHGNAGIRDAIDVSFVETLDFSDTKKRSRRWAWDIFPDSLKEMYVRFHGRPGIDP